MISFFINFEPDIPKSTHQVGIRAGVAKDGKPFIYKDTQYRELEAMFVSKMIDFAPDTPLGKNIQLKTLWVFNSGKCDGIVCHRNKKPDTDNLVKGFKDAMTTCGFWSRDEYVVRETIEKVDAPSDFKHGVYVWISELTDTKQATATLASIIFRKSNTSEARQLVDALTVSQMDSRVKTTSACSISEATRK